MIAYQLDTNALLRYLTKDIPSQSKQVRGLMTEAKRGKASLHICEPIFIETAVTLRNFFKFSREKVSSLLSDLLSAPELNIENRDQLAKANAYYHDVSIDFLDCVLLVRSQIQHHKLFTFDSRLSLLASAQSKTS